jgi:hypothetical protein
MSPSKYYREERPDNIWSTPNGVVTARTPGLPGGIYDYVQCPHALVDEISMIDLEGKKLKTVKHCFVD